MRASKVKKDKIKNQKGEQRNETKRKKYKRHRICLYALSDVHIVCV